MRKLSCINKLIFLSLFAFIFLSCDNLLQKNDELAIDSNTAYVCVKAARFSGASRTAIPFIDINELSDFVLTGSDGLSTTTLATADSLSELSSKMIEIEEGIWSFRLHAKYEGVEFQGITSNTAVNGQIMSLAFTLSPSIMKGGFSITVSFEGEADLVGAVLYREGSSNQNEYYYYDPAEDTVKTDSSYHEIQLSINTNTQGVKSVTFDFPVDENQGLGHGDYRAKISFYNKGTFINAYYTAVHIVDGFSSKASAFMNLAEAFSVTFNLNGGDFKEENSLVGFTKKSGEITLPTNVRKLGYSFAGWYENYDENTGEYSDGPVTTIPVGTAENKTFWAKWDELIVNYVQKPFSVSEDRQVYFSRGNLWYQASTSTFAFADNQYDIVGKVDNEAAFTAFISNDPTSYNGWTDLFEWGSSGAGISGINYPPYTRKFPDGLQSALHIASMTGANAELDWGVHNSISGGGNGPGHWRTLTLSEWDYLFHSRSGAPSKRAPARVDGIAGMILFPDTWNPELMPDGLSLNYTNTTNSSDYYGTNIYTALEWSQLEALGAVFLPVTGTCYSVSSSATSPSWDGYDGSDTSTSNTKYVSYWTATAYSAGSDTKYKIYTSNGGYNKANIGTYNASADTPAAVRLIQDCPDYYTVPAVNPSVLYVSSTGSASGDGSEDNAFATVSQAVNKIISFSEAQDYTIFVDGIISTGQTISSISSAYAKSITVKGKNGINAVTEEPLDALAGSYTYGSGTSMLLVETAVPVIVEDLKISGGYNLGGGVRVGSNTIKADVTLGSGTIITGNKNYNNGAGVYVTEGSKLELDGAIIKENIADRNPTEALGIGVYSLGRELVIKGNSKITGNSSTGTSGNYSAVYCLGTSNKEPVTIEGNAEISNNEVRGLYVRDVTLSIKGNAKISGNQNQSTSSGVGSNGGGGLYASMKSYEFTISISENAEISGNTAKNGGGICINSDYVNVNFEGGTISGNTVTSGGNGNGVYLNMATSTQNRFNMSGSSVIASNNDIYLASANSKITVGSLTPPSGVTTVATITPYEYNTTTPVLNGSVEEEYQKFAVTPDGSTNYEIANTGKLQESTGGGTSGNVVTLYVKDGGTGDGSSETSPLGSIAGAASYIGAQADYSDPNNVPDSETDYIIKVIGMLSGEQSLSWWEHDPITIKEAKSITIEGATGLGLNDIPQDGFTGIGEDDTDKCSLEIHSDGINVTLRNIKITGYKTGLCVGDAYIDPDNTDDVFNKVANVILDSGVLITDVQCNHMDSKLGGGVTVKPLSKLYMKSGAKIISNESYSFGGGVNINDGAYFYMQGGEISGNTLQVGAGGSGVYVGPSSYFAMSGDANVASNNDVYLDEKDANYAKITIASTLTAESPVATITPYRNNSPSYDLTKAYLAVTSDSGTSLESEYNKFAVTPINKMVQVGGALQMVEVNYIVNESGMLEEVAGSSGGGGTSGIVVTSNAGGSGMATILPINEPVEIMISNNDETIDFTKLKIKVGSTEYASDSLRNFVTTGTTDNENSYEFSFGSSLTSTGTVIEIYYDEIKIETLNVMRTGNMG